jgi:hypothetical protein
MSVVRPASALARVPVLWSVGLLVAAVGVAGDLAYHTLSPSIVQPALGADGMNAHVVTLLGMALIFLAVVRRGLRRE